MLWHRRYQKLWKSYVKLRHLLANSPKVKQIDKQKLTQREVSPRCRCFHFVVLYLVVMFVFI